MKKHLYQEHYESLSNIAIDVRYNTSIAKFSSWRIGGRAAIIINVSSTYELEKILLYCKSNQLDFIIIGRGSNLLFDDKGIDGVVIRIAERFSEINVNKNTLSAQAGAYVPCLARKASKHSLAGLEHIIGIPGSVGGLVSMNGGSQRKSIDDFIKRIHVITLDGNKQVLNKYDCDFSYRQSIFQKNTDRIITSVDFDLVYGEELNIKNSMINILRERRKKFPLKQPNCGSVFKSSPELYEEYGPPGKIIDDLSLKGYTIGGAQVSTTHANFIVNNGNATTDDVITLIEYLREKVRLRTNITLQTEVKRVLHCCKISDL